MDEFAEALNREEWFFVFSGYGLYEKIKPVMDNVLYPNGKRPPLALMVEWGTENYIPDVRFISLPVQSLSIANTLNGKADDQDYYDSSAAGSKSRFVIPGARLLVVDDIGTNLKVAEGLLAPYKATVDTCLSGAEAIELIKRRAKLGEDYDLVFMDHMMPEMDGIETTLAIRAWEKEQSSCSQASEFPLESPGKLLHRQIPIIALTANAVSGMRELFLKNGFNDFLAKPIDVSKLDEMLDSWIPKEKREERKEKKEKKLVLLVYDNPANLKSGRSVLLKTYNVITAPSLEKMFILLENNSPAVILLGSNMPQPDHLNILSGVDIPVIFIPEPLDTTELIACVDKHFERGGVS
jgi:CheY-like chemotaxis protein